MARLGEGGAGPLAAIYGVISLGLLGSATKVMTVTREEVLAKLTKLTSRRKRKQLEQVDDDTPLFSTGTIDSFALIDLATWLGKKLGKRFTADDVTLEDLDSIANIMTFTAKHSS